MSPLPSHICSVTSGKMAMRSRYTHSISHFCFRHKSYCKMLASIGSYLSNFPLQKKQTHVANIVPCPAPPVWTEVASANAWADVKALLKKGSPMRIWFHFGGKLTCLLGDFFFASGFLFFPLMPINCKLDGGKETGLWVVNRFID